MNVDPELPFRTNLKPRWIPAEMVHAPDLPEIRLRLPVTPWYALLLNPFYPKDPHASFGKHVLTPSLALTSVAAATPPQWHVRYWDENLLQGEPPWNPVPQVVGITVHLTFAQRAYELARWYRERGSIVVLGGLHVLSCPDEAAAHGDVIAIGNGVTVWPQILNDIERGTLRKCYHATYENKYAEEPAPRRDLAPKESFLTTASIIATRGCHNRCGFCYLSTRGNTMPYRTHSISEIVSQFETSGEPYAVFTDNNLGSKPEYLRMLCRGLRPIKRIWSAAVTLDVTDDPALVREMALAGCTGVFIGFESLQGENLIDARKKTPRPEDYARRVRLFHEYGIQVNGSFVLGFDHDRRDVFATTAQWIEQNRMECATFHILTPYPGTPLFEQMERENRLLHKDWSRYDTSHAVFQPRHMSPEELEHGYQWLYQRLFSHASIWHRRPAGWRAVAPYLAMSYLYKRSNRFWRFLIKHRLVHTVWRPLVEWTRLRHVRFREGLLEEGNVASMDTCGPVVSAGV